MTYQLKMKTFRIRDLSALTREKMQEKKRKESQSSERQGTRSRKAESPNLERPSTEGMVGGSEKTKDK